MALSAGCPICNEPLASSSQQLRSDDEPTVLVTSCSKHGQVGSFCFKGGELVYTGPTITSNVMTVDFISMYPSIMASCGVSPETIDYVTPSYSQTYRFDHITTIGKYSIHNTACIVILIVCGTISGKVNTPDTHHIIGEFCTVFEAKKYSADSISASCKYLVRALISEEYESNLKLFTLHKEGKGPPLKKNSKILNRVIKQPVKCMILQCHCFQMQCTRKDSDSSSTCFNKCLDENGERCVWLDGKGCFCNICNCNCNKRYKKQDAQLI